MAEISEYIFDREFDAPLELVWKAWTDPELLSRWYGPNIETVIHEFDLRPGGVWHNEMKMRGMSDYSKMNFIEIVEQEKMIWNQSSTDADWNVINSTMMPNWPKVLLTTVTFTVIGDKTNVRLHMVPVDASDEEIATFKGAMAGLSSGWGSGYKIIDEILKELQS